MKYFNYAASEDGIVPDHLVASCSADGDKSQLATIVNEESVKEYDRKGVLAWKHNAAGTAVGQAANCGRQFVTAKSLNKKLTVKEIPSDQHLLKGALERKFKQLRAEKILLLKKQAGAVDFLAKFPVVYTRSCTRDNVLHGFHRNGQLDTTLGMVPVFHQCIATRRSIPTLAELQIVLNAFFPSMDYSFKNGMKYISDTYLIEEHGFPPDLNKDGKEKIRDAGISRESEQRAKVLNGLGEKKKRADRIAYIELEAKRKENDKKFKKELAIRDDERIVKALCGYAGMYVFALEFILLQANVNFAQMLSHLKITYSNVPSNTLLVLSDQTLFHSLRLDRPT